MSLPPGESRARAINPVALGAPKGFTHGWLAPAGARLLFVAGQTATDASGHVIDGGLVPQFDAALGRALAVVADAGGRAEDVLRMTVYVTDLDAYLAGRRALGTVWQRHMGAHYPAMALVEVSRLVDEGAVVEIEVTAAVPEAGEAHA